MKKEWYNPNDRDGKVVLVLELTKTVEINIKAVKTFNSTFFRVVKLEVMTETESLIADTLFTTPTAAKKAASKWLARQSIIQFN